jgi:hypothetical protein
LKYELLLAKIFLRKVLNNSYTQNEQNYAPIEVISVAKNALNLSGLLQHTLSAREARTTFFLYQT